jgi:hypothetical protein
MSDYEHRTAVQQKLDKQIMLLEEIRNLLLTMIGKEKCVADDEWVEFPERITPNAAGA